MFVNHQICHSFCCCCCCNLNHGTKTYPIKISQGLLLKFITTIPWNILPPKPLRTFSSNPLLISSPWPVLQAKVHLSLHSLPTPQHLPLLGSTLSPVDSYLLLKHCHQIWSQCITKLPPNALLIIISVSKQHFSKWHKTAAPFSIRLASRTRS